MRAMHFLLMVVLMGAMIVGAQDAPVKSKGKVDPGLLMKFEKTLDTIESNFTVAISSSDESDWMKEYMAKFAEFKDTARNLQTDIIKSGLAKDINLPKYVIVMSEALIDCRKAYKSCKNVNISLLDNASNSSSRSRSTSRGNSSDDILTKAGSGNRNVSKGELALRSSFQDFKLAAAHLRENLSSLNKSKTALNDAEINRAISHRQDACATFDIKKPGRFFRPGFSVKIISDEKSSNLCG